MPAIRAELALENRNPEKAITAIEPATMYELGDPGDVAIALVMYPPYVRGQAYLAAGDGAKLAIEFQKTLDHPGVIQKRVIGALAHLEIARAYKLQGNTKRVQAAYQDFLSLWREADPSLTVLRKRFPNTTDWTNRSICQSTG